VFINNICALGKVLAFLETEMANIKQMNQSTLKCRTSCQILDHLWYQEKKTDRQDTNAHFHCIFINPCHKCTSVNFS